MTFKIVPIWVKCCQQIKWGFRCWVNKATEWKAVRAACPRNMEAQYGEEHCKHVDQTGSSATERKAGSGRPKSARSDTNIARVEELICSQGQSGQPPVRLPLNSISVTDQSIVLRRKISIVWIMLLYYMFIWPFLNARKSVGGIPATPIILRQCLWQLNAVYTCMMNK